MRLLINKYIKNIIINNNRSLVPSSLCYTMKYRYLSSSSSTPPPVDPNPRQIGIIEEDLLYQQNSTDLFIRLKTVLQGFVNYSKINKLYEVSGEYSPLIWLSLSTNYLLTKYQFDAYDFHIGSKHAIKRLQLGIASTELYNYVNKYNNDKTVNDFLKDTLHPILYKGCVDALSHLNDNKQMIIMKDIEILNAKICSVNTYIVTSVEEEEEEDVTVINGIEMSKRVKYPVGSVIVEVDVAFLASSTYVYHLENETKEEVKAGNSVWTFQSCISNHIPQSWIVTRFDGLGA